MGTDTEFVKIETLFPKCAIFTAPIAHDLEATMQAEWVSHGIPRKWPVGIPHFQTERCLYASDLDQRFREKTYEIPCSPLYPHHIPIKSINPLYLPMKITIIHPKIREIPTKKTLSFQPLERKHPMSAQSNSPRGDGTPKCGDTWHGITVWPSNIGVEWGFWDIFTCGKMCKSDYVFHCCQERVAKKIPHWS
jgi:hypothetical protein